MGYKRGVYLCVEHLIYYVKSEGEYMGVYLLVLLYMFDVWNISLKQEDSEHESYRNFSSRFNLGWLPSYVTVAVF